MAAFRDRQTEEAPRRVADAMLKRVQSMHRAATAPNAGEDQPVMSRLAGEILAARRAALVKARDERKLDDEVMREVLEQMDFEEAAMLGADLDPPLTSGALRAGLVDGGGDRFDLAGRIGEPL